MIKILILLNVTLINWLKLTWQNPFHNKKWERLWYWKFYFKSYVWKIWSNYIKKSVRYSAKPKHEGSPADVFLWKGVHSSKWVFCKFAAYFSEHLFIGKPLEDCFCKHNTTRFRRMSEDCRIITHLDVVDHLPHIPWK